MKIRKAIGPDLNNLLEVERLAFGNVEGPQIVELVQGLLIDPTAAPILSLIAEHHDRVMGHILFTKARIALNEQIPAAILAPLAVVPDAQGQGVGGQLIREGLRLLSEAGVKLVFLLGHPDYYPRYGFKTAGLLGFEPPYRIPDEHANAWMVQELGPGFLGSINGKVLCADALNQPEYWCE